MDGSASSNRQRVVALQCHTPRTNNCTVKYHTDREKYCIVSYTYLTRMRSVQSLSTGRSLLVVSLSLWLLLLTATPTPTRATQARRTTSSSTRATTVATTAVHSHQPTRTQRPPKDAAVVTAQQLPPRGGTAAGTAVAVMPAWKADLLHRAKVGFYFGLWYALNIVYNSKYM